MTKKTAKIRIARSDIPMPIVRLIPHCLTLIALSLGMLAIRFALDAKWENAVSLIVIAGIIDGLDGRVARMLNVSSNFGAQLDSLADLISFGFAPTMIAYLWNLHEIEINRLAWAVVLFYVICSAIRLARFNSSISAPNLSKHFAMGVPMPAAAILLLTPIMVNFQIPEYFTITPIIYALYIFFISLLMIARFPTYQLKGISFNIKHANYILMLMGCIITAMIIEPWFTIPLLSCIYLISIPIITLYFYKYNRDSIKN